MDKIEELKRFTICTHIFDKIYSYVLLDCKFGTTGYYFARKFLDVVSKFFENESLRYKISIYSSYLSYLGKSTTPEIACNRNEALEVFDALYAVSSSQFDKNII